MGSHVGGTKRRPVPLGGYEIGKGWWEVREGVVLMNKLKAKVYQENSHRGFRELVRYLT